MDPNPYESPQAVDDSQPPLDLLEPIEGRHWTWADTALLVGVLLTVFVNPALGLGIACVGGLGIVLQSLGYKLRWGLSR